MEIHPAIKVPGSTATLPELTTYVSRPHDQQLQQVVGRAKTHSDIAVLVGDSSTGKTRACWEAIQTLPSTWNVWQPITLEELGEALSENVIEPRTVVWLNDLHSYLITPDSEVGERIAANLRGLLRSLEQRPVLVVATLWREHWDMLIRHPGTDLEDRHAQARMLLRSHEIAVPEVFNEDELNCLRAICADDPRMMEAASRPDGKVTQFIAGAFELNRIYHLAPSPQHALITAAMDIKRFGWESLITESLLIEAAQGYLDDDARDNLQDDWSTSALKYTSRRSLGVPGPLTKIRPRSGRASKQIATYRLSDYLEQESRKARKFIVPPDTFWTACAEHVSTVDELHELAFQAESRARFRWAAAFYIRMAQEGDLAALQFLADHRWLAGDHLGAEMLLNEAIGKGHMEAWADLAKHEKQKGNIKAAEQLLEKAGQEPFILEERARLKELSGDYDAAQSLLEMAVADGSFAAKWDLAIFLESHGRDLSRVLTLREELGPDNVIDKLVAASDDVRRSEKMLDDIEQKFVSAACESNESIEKISEIWRTAIGRERGESVEELITIGRIALNLGRPDVAEQRFRRALDGGSMRDDGSNRALTLLAEAMKNSGNFEMANNLLKYGLEPDGAIAEPWQASIDHPERLPFFKA